MLAITINISKTRFVLVTIKAAEFDQVATFITSVRAMDVAT
jgi:hypothetical protein